MRLYRILLNIASSLSRNFVGLILGIIATPIILNYLGEEQFGAYRVLNDWVAQLGILEFGLFPSLQVIFAKTLSKSSKLSAASVSRQAHQGYLRVLIYQILGLILIGLLLKQLIPVSPQLEADLKLALIIMGVSLIFAFSQVYRAFLDASQRGYVVSSSMIIQNIVFIGASLTLAFLGFGIIGQAIAFSLSIASSFLILFFKTRKQLQDSQPKESEEKTFSLSLKEQRTPQFAANLFGRVSLLMDNMIISALLGAKTVTAFYLTQRLLNLSMQQLQQIGNATWPAMSELYFLGEKEKFSNRVLEVTEMIAFAAGVLLSVLCFFNPPFVILWTGESTFAGLTLSSIVLYNVGLISIVSFWQWCFTGTGFIRKILPNIAVQAIVNVGFSLVLTKTMGLVGPALGTLISFQLITIPWQTYLMRDMFEVSYLKLTRAWLIPFALPVLSSIAAVHYLGFPQIENWVSLIFMAGLTTIVCGTLFIFLFLKKQTRQAVVSRTRRVIDRKLNKII